jgi:hypothetical protein
MAIVTIDELYLQNIGAAIRTKNGQITTYKPKEMADAILTIPTSGGDDSGSSINVSNFAISTRIQYLGDHVFQGWPIVSVTVDVDYYGNNNLRSIGQWCFAENTYLKSVDLSSAKNMTILGDLNSRPYNSYAFYKCTNLSTVSLPPNLEIIGESAFRDCSSLTSITLPNSLKSIRAFAFDGAGLTSITIPALTTEIGDSWNGATFAECYDLKKVIFKGIPSFIHETTFYGLSGLVINVPWSPGQVSGAPWGAINPIINYNS